MPMMKGMLRSLQKEHGAKKGKEVYYAMENKAGGTKGKLRSAMKKGMFARRKEMM